MEIETQAPDFLLEHGNQHSALQPFKLPRVSLHTGSEQSELLCGVFVLCCTQSSPSLVSAFPAGYLLLPCNSASRTLAILCHKQGTG